MLTKELENKYFNLPQETHPERLWTIKQVGDSKGKIIYDLGCGMNRTIPEAIGVDLYKTPPPSLIASLDELPIKDSTADFLISRHSLEHMLDPIKTLSEWNRALKAGGKLVIVLPDHEFADTMRLGAGHHLHAYTRSSFMNLIHSCFPNKDNTFDEEFRIEVLETVLSNWSFGAVLKKCGL
jgi:SAM-dependent methyltransferase